MHNDIKTTCPYCGVGCGIIVSPSRDGQVVGGDPDHPANRGRLCSKGAALIDSITAESRDDFRLETPLIDGTPADWPTAIAQTAHRLADTIARHGPRSVAFYVSGQLLTEDYYVANKLLKGFIGSPHIDTNSRLCMASTVVGHKRAFGSDIVPGCYEDLEIADLVILTGSNLAWCHPVLFQRLRAARQKNGTKIIVIDPRKTASCDIADLHLPLAPGSDVALFNGLLAWLADQAKLDHTFLTRHVSGTEDALASAHADCPDIATTAQKCGLSRGDVEQFFNLFADHARTVTVFSQGVNQSSSGSDKVNAIINVHLATGRVGLPGSSPFSVTGQPNAMGGREVGGLANQLAAHMDPNNPFDVDRLARFWNAPNLQQGEGYKAVDLFDAVATGEIKAIWVMATNPVVSLPDTSKVRAALANCPLVIVSDVVNNNDTLKYAHIKLPASAWGEKSGTVTNSERRISRQRPFRQGPALARPDWWIMAEIAKKMGFDHGFEWQDVAEIFAEHAALSEFENDGLRAFDIGEWAQTGKSLKPRYDAMAPFQWPASRHYQPKTGAKRLFGDGLFATSNRRARMVSLRYIAPRSNTSPDYPLIANSGRYRDQWHTMTRTGTVARLCAHRPEPLLEMHPDDARNCDLGDGDIARITSHQGTALMRVSLSPSQAVGQIFVPMHWNDSFSSASSIGQLVAPHVDPLSGQPESKHIAVSVSRFNACWQAVLLTNDVVDLQDVPYWVRTTGQGCNIIELAGETPIAFSTLLPDFARQNQPGIDDTNGINGTNGTNAINDIDLLEYNDIRRATHRYASIRHGKLGGALFVGPTRQTLGRDWISSLFGQNTLPTPDRMALLAGHLPDASAANDKLICSCFSVGLAKITNAICTQNAVTTDDIGRLLEAGTGCGSCLPELQDIIDTTAVKAAE
ncbi:nitrate reductase [Thalassospira mesophila]|uniref:Nitrate reductase n=1 Tax=Thalassospira mesophila TaxID=1293891 RepID=A0A1Y2KVS7_9PROT|nr:nitrate reductase [Thalassospira mesophila]OSQ35576.1 nitrate reductase [Thalassospira mesophila]